MTKTTKSVFKKILSGLAVLILLIVAIFAIWIAYFTHKAWSVSTISIYNSSGLGIRFEQVTIDDQVVMKNPHTLVTTIKDSETPRPDSSQGQISIDFRAPKDDVEVTFVVLDEMQRRETLSCTLDNRRCPCKFNVYYFKGRLSCHRCIQYWPD